MTSDKRMSVTEVHAFLTDRELYAVDPDTGAIVASVTYRGDGTCHAVMSANDDSPGTWGLTDTGYWTKYDRFREGQRHEFTLIRLSEHAAQAYFGDGRRAFTQTTEAPAR